MLALGCGLVASIGITQLMAKHKKEPAGPPGQTQSVFVALTNIGMGELLGSQDLKLEQWPKDKVPAGAISRLEDIEGRRAMTKLYAGEPIMDNKLLGKGASAQGATALIPRDFRVVPVKVDLVSGGSSLILPGDRVDVMVHLFKDRNRGIPETITKVILQDIKVFAVNDVVELQSDDSGKSISAKTISLLVTPKQAAQLTMASQLGKIQLVMRSPEDDKQIANVEATPGELMGFSEKSDREKESLVRDTDAEGRNKGFKEFLDDMKKNLAADKAAAPSAKTLSVWIMRIIKPGEVDEVRFEEEEGGPGAAAPSWTVKAVNAGETPAPPKEMPAPPSEPQGPKLGGEDNAKYMDDK